MPCNLLILCHPLFLLYSISPNIKVFSSESALHISWPNYSTGVSASTSVLPMNIHHWFPLELTGLISSLSKGLSRVFSSTTVWKPSILRCSAFLMVLLTSVHDYWKNYGFVCRPLSAKWCFCFLIRCLGLSELFPQGTSIFNSKEQAIAAVTVCSDFGAQENKVFPCFYFYPIYLPWSDGTRYHDLSFLNVEF